MRCLIQAAVALQLPLWSPVVDGQLYAYSAHWDIRAVYGMEPPFVRLLMTLRNSSYEAELASMKLVCRFYFLDGSRDPVDVQGKLEKLRFFPPKKIGPPENDVFMLLCPGHDFIGEGSTDSLPRAVSIESKDLTGYSWTYEVCGPLRRALACCGRHVCNHCEGEGPTCFRIDHAAHMRIPPCTT